RSGVRRVDPRVAGHVREQRQGRVCHESDRAPDCDMMDWSRAIDSCWIGFVATSPAEAVSVALGLAYAVLAIRRSRWCWATGGLSSAIMIYLSLNARLPMQAALQVYYVVISVYGWWHWTREEGGERTLGVTHWAI